MSAERERPEILAPAGDMASLEAAIAAGADAVYLGLKSWSARARAENFGEDALGRAMATLHRAGRRGYVALNTLVFENELEEVVRSIHQCADAGVDAIIVQDLGVMRLIRTIAPSVPIHASTQMTCTDAESVEVARKLGASRVILARELSLDDIARIKEKTTVPLEVFVHGALCIAYSGQCLTSEAIGGRSANRGACAQACRLPYELFVDGQARPTGDRAFLLSPLDLDASELVPKLCELGISSLKIEGRLKEPEYVAATTTLYRSVLDQHTTEQEKLGARELAQATFTRGAGPGFLAGVDHQRLVEGRSSDHRGRFLGRVLKVVREGKKVWLRLSADQAPDAGLGLIILGGLGGKGELGGRIWLTREGPSLGSFEVWLGPDVDGPSDVAVGREVYVSSDPGATKRARALATQAPAKRPIELWLTAHEGQPLSLRGRLKDLGEASSEATVVGEAPLALSQKGAPSLEFLTEKLGRLGDSPYRLEGLHADVVGSPLVPPSALNALRRALIEELERKAHRRHPIVALTEKASPPLTAPLSPGLWVLCRNLEQARGARAGGADGVWLDFLELQGVGAATRILREEGPGQIGLAPPRIRKPDEDKIDRYLDSLSPDALLVRALGGLLSDSPAPRVGDFSLNIANRWAAKEALSFGLSGFTPSFDLNEKELFSLLDGGFGPHAELVIHHPMPMFHMEHCVYARELSTGHDHRDCGRPCERHQLSLRDRAGLMLPVIADVGCRNTVFHAHSQSGASLVGGLKQKGVQRFRVELVRESQEETATIVGAYRALLDGRATGPDIYRKLRAESTYGVVRGSLRVLS